MGHEQEVRRPGINQTSLQHRGKRKQLDLPAPPVRELALVAAAAVAAAGGPEIVETALGWASQCCRMPFRMLPLLAGLLRFRRARDLFQLRRSGLARDTFNMKATGNSI